MGKPKPFQNPRIEVTSAWLGSKKEWMDITPDRISVGDLIIGKGVVVAVLDRVAFRDPAVLCYSFEMKSGQHLSYADYELVRVFTEGTSPWLLPSSTLR